MCSAYHECMRSPALRHQRGFTIYESLVAVAIGGTVIAGLATANNAIIINRLITKTINEIAFIGEAAQNFHIDNGEFPNQSGNCANALAQMVTTNYLGGGGTNSPFGTPFVTTCPSPNVFRVSVTLPTAFAAGQVAAGVARSDINVLTVTSNFTLPGAVPGLRAYLRRTSEPGFPDSNRMQQTLNMDGNPILNTRRVAAVAGQQLRLESNNAVVVAGAPLQVDRAQFRPDQGGSLELGGNDGQAGTGTPYIDFHTVGGGVTDFNARIIAPAPNQLNLIATGQIAITTANLNTSGNLTATGVATARDVRVGDIGNFSLTRAIQDARIVENGDFIPKPTCPAGMTRGVNFGTERCAEGPTPSIFYGWEAFAVDDINPNRWVTNIRVFTGLGAVVPAPGYCRVSSMTFCY